MDWKGALWALVGEFSDVKLAWNWRTEEKEELAFWKIEYLMKQFSNQNNKKAWKWKKKKKIGNIRSSYFHSC